MADKLDTSAPAFSQEGPATMSDRNFKEAIELLAERDKEIAKLCNQIQEILRINHYWEEEYKELKKNFDLYRDDSKKAQHENHSLIARLKKEKSTLHEQISSVKCDKEKLEKKLHDLRTKYEHQKKLYGEAILQLKKVSTHHKTPPMSPTGIPLEHENGKTTKKLAELCEEISLLTSQIHIYKEDFEAEKRDRERLASEKETEKLRYEAEIASLKIQLDRISRDMVWYKTETTKLSQQLRLKQQREDDEYRRHLEKQGYSPRKPLPPLDPFVEKDIFYQKSSSTPPISPVTTTPPYQLSSSYHTHMNETHPPTHYRQRRISAPTYKGSGNHHGNDHGKAGCQGNEVLRSVSPQIHRIGNLRLYSRESDPDLLNDNYSPDSDILINDNTDTN